MKVSNIMKSLLFSSIVFLPVYAIADDNLSSTLTNRSKQSGSEGYTLVQEKTWGEKDCVKVEGSEKLNPGDSNKLKIKKGCDWGGVGYKIVAVKDNQEVGRLGHSFHGGDFSIDITADCKGTECNFYDLNPVQNRSK